MRKLAEYFVRGLLFFIPVVLTISILGFVFLKIDSWLGINVRGVGFILTLGIITLVGYFTTNIFTRGIISLIDQIFSNVPFVKLVYKSIRDFIDAFVGKKKKFNRPVLVTVLPESDGKALGFITNEELEHFGLNNHVVVYMPQSYNFAGQTLIFPKDKVKPLPDIPPTELMTFVVSAGVAGRHDMLNQ